MSYARPVGRALARVLSALVFLLGGLLLGLGLLFVIVAGIMWPGEYPIKFKSDDGEKASADAVVTFHGSDVTRAVIDGLRNNTDGIADRLRDAARWN